MVEFKNTCAAFFAYDVVLSTKKQLKYTKAEYTRATDTVELTRDVFVCPFCGSHTPAYLHYVYNMNVRKRISRDNAADICGNIKSMFDNEDRKIQLYKPLDTRYDFTCPNCGEVSKCSSDTENITFERKKHLVRLSCKLNSITDIINLDWASSLDISSLGMIESIVFNFKKGTVYFELHSFDGTLIKVMDVTSGLPLNKQKSKLTNLLNKNSFVKSKLIKYFNIMWGKKIPFSINELDLYKFICMTTYIGYNKDFYYNIPDEDYDFTFDTSFKKLRKRLHKIDNCINIMKASELPQSKTIRKAIFTTPSLFFFIDEIEKFWKIAEGDHNLLSEFLCSSNALANLYTLHTYPSAIDFYKDYVKTKSPYAFFKLIIRFNRTAAKYGIFYSALSEHHKAKERKKWDNLSTSFKNRRNHLVSDSQLHRMFSTEDEDPKVTGLADNTCNGYAFTVLKTRTQRVLAGEQLNNCLKTTQFKNPVIGVMKCGRYVAAIEIDMKNRLVLQAYIKNNEHIENNKFIYTAIKKWCNANKFCYHNARTGIDFDDDDYYDNNINQF